MSQGNGNFLTKTCDDSRLPRVRKLMNPPDSVFKWAPKYFPVRAEDVGDLGVEWIVARSKAPMPNEETLKEKVEWKKPGTKAQRKKEVIAARQANANRARTVIKAACNSWQTFSNSMHHHGYFKVCDRWLPTLNTRVPGQPRSTLAELARRTEYKSLNNIRLQLVAKQMKEVIIMTKNVAGSFSSMLTRLKNKDWRHSLGHTSEAIDDVLELLLANIRQCEAIEDQMGYCRLRTLSVANHQPKIEEILRKAKEQATPAKCESTPRQPKIAEILRKAKEQATPAKSENASHQPKIGKTLRKAKEQAMPAKCEHAPPKIQVLKAPTKIMTAASTSSKKPMWWELEVLPRPTRSSLNDADIIDLTQGTATRDFQFLKPEVPPRRGRPKKKIPFEGEESQ